MTDAIREQLAQTVSDLRAERDQIRADARRALAVLDNCTTEEFSRGGDRPAREALARILGIDESAAR